MQKSKSIFSFRPKPQHTESRSQRRSSLDTFVIPGRTRLPSSETSQSSLPSQDAINIKIAQTLINHRVILQSQLPPMRRPPHHSEGGSYAPVPQRSPTSMFGSGLFNLRRTRRPRGPQPASSSDYQDLLVIDPGQPVQLRSTPQFSVTETTEDPFHDQVDGQTDMTSMNSSAVNRRFISDSSAGSQASRALNMQLKYNDLAQDLGLPLLQGDDSSMYSPNCDCLHISLTMF